MRLINIRTLKLEEFLDDKFPSYAILSHTWGDDSEELTLRNVEEGEVDKLGVGSVKFRGCCQQAKKDGHGYVWIDTCCIDKTNLVELSEAINSMFRWYKRASVCYAYLSDVPGDDHPRKPGSKFQTSRWFQRGWTLQELLAPKSLEFYNSEWRCLGTKGRLCAVIENITGIPRLFLKGVTELHTASVAQRMSWAAQRNTKRKEDLAYCLLGIFGIAMPMIYGEGGDQAFFRLQEQIMKTTRDHSILAWGLNTKESSISDWTQVTAGKILAAAPSDFANSGQIVSREQFAVPMYSLDISGGSLRVSLSLLTTSSETIGLLNCGPEDDTEQAVAIPLVKVMLGGSDEYIRPRGCHSMLRPMTASNTLRKLIQIKNDSGSETQVSNQRRWVYDDDDFADVHLELVDVAPRYCWDKEQAVIISTIESGSGGGAHRSLARFRHDEEGSWDFVMILEFEQRGACIEAQYCVTICSRDTSLEELAGKLQYVTEKASGKRSASNGLLNLRVTLKPVAERLMFVIRPEAMPHPPDVTINATIELQKLHLMLEIARILGEGGQNNAEEEELDQRVKAKSDRLEQAKRELEMVDDDLRKLEEKRRMLVEEISDGVQDEKQAEVLERQQHESERWLCAHKRWDELQHIDCGEDGYELKRIDRQTPLLWASENGYAKMVKLLLGDGVDVAVANKDGWTPLIAAASKGHADVVRQLLATSKVDVDSKDSEDGRTPLSWAAASGHEAVVQLLLSTGKVDTNSKDNNGRTPLRWAAERGHETVVQLLLETRGTQATGDNGEEKWRETDNETPVGISTDRELKVPLRYMGTLLLQAAQDGEYFLAQQLLQGGVDPDSKDANGWTPLLWAANRGHGAVVRLLLENGGDIDFRAPEGLTPFWTAAYSGDGTVVRLLREWFDQDSKDSSDQLALRWAAYNGEVEKVRTLLEKGLDPNSRDRWGTTPLYWAASNGHDGVVELLLEQKVVVDSNNPDGRTPLFRAAYGGSEHIVRLLVKNGADPYFKDRWGETPIFWATRLKYEKVIKLLN